MLVTTAVRFPSDVGLVLKVTVIDVAEAVVTVPTAPLLNTTVFRLAVVSKPNPLMIMLLELIPRSAVLRVTLGITDAICTAVPLVTLLTVTIAVRLPTVGLAEKVTVSRVGVAVVTVPTAPLLNTTVFLFAVVSKPVPVIVTVLELAG